MLSANATRRCVAKTGLGRQVETAVNFTFSRLALALGVAECATRQTLHVAESVPSE